MYCSRNLCDFAGRSTRCNSGKCWSVSPRSFLKSMRVPTRLSDVLEICMSAVGNHNPTPPSIWYRSPVAGSLTGRGWNCARAGADTIRNASVRLVVRLVSEYKRTAGRFIIRGVCSGKSTEARWGGPAMGRRFQDNSKIFVWQ